MDEGRRDLNEAGIRHAKASRVLTRDEKLRSNALRYVLKVKHQRKKASRVLTRDEKLRRSALRYMRRAIRKKMTQTGSNTSVIHERPLPLSDKKVEPQFFFILHHPPMTPVPAGSEIPTRM